jgi:hypothetical protein
MSAFSGKVAPFGSIPGAGIASSRRQLRNLTHKPSLLVAIDRQGQCAAGRLTTVIIAELPILFVHDLCYAYT